MKELLRWLAFAMAMLPVVAYAVGCSATSGARRVPLLELYTSEGCDSCPPTDKWVHGLPARGLTSERLVALAFHVDYWNHLGWSDPYAKSQHSERQRAIARRNAGRFVYTPQLLLNGKDYRRGLARDDLADRVSAINRDPPPASVSLSLDVGASQLVRVTGEAVVRESSRSGARGYLALFENRLASQVLAGENRGRRLEHDFVVRELAGPFAPNVNGTVPLAHKFVIDRTWKQDDIGVAAFVSDEHTGEVLQALALGICRG